ncbi:MAG: DUF2992 family protein [Ancrocorticia sp.]
MGTSTVWFNGQFWVLTIEVTARAETYSAQRILGREPPNAELYDLLNTTGGRLIDEALNSPSAHNDSRTLKHSNPKRAAREAAKQDPAPSTASQEAIRLAREAHQSQRRIARKEDMRKEKEEIRQKRRRKARDKHRGH